MYSPRSPKSQSDYEQFKKTHQDTPERLHYFDLSNETIIREFTHWVIIKNRFPYDNMAHTNDLLVARESSPDLYSASKEAQTEFREIMQLLAAEGCYDAKIENFPKATSAKAQFHVHLVLWHGSQAGKA